MKIGLVCPYSMARGGAVQEIVRAMRKELIARGHEAKIITPQPKEIDGIDTDGIIFVGSQADFHSPLGTTADVSTSIDSEALEQMLESENFDILHFHEPWQPFLSKQILSYSKSINIATFHAKIPETLVARTVINLVTPYTKPLLKYLHELVAVSEPASEYVGALTDQPITIIPNAIHLADFPWSDHKFDPTQQLNILFVGRLEKRKGVKYLLQAYSLLAQRMDNVSLTIAGKGPDQEKLEELAAELALPNVHFLGYVDDATKKQLFAEADLFCAPAIFGESFGVVLLEAMSTGLVTIAGSNSGYVSVMQDLGALSVVNPLDTEDFARRMELLLTQPALREEWRSWAREYVKQFDYTSVMDQYETLYEDALHKHTPGKKPRERKTHTLRKRQLRK
ncbi:phosphatidyl-myo-inositol alpha-mannosyltransferase [soil metagenome]